MKILKRFFGYTAFLIFLFNALGLTLIYSYRDAVLKKVVEFLVSESTGFRTRIGTLHHEFPAVFTLRDVTMDNPSGYEPQLFATSHYFFIEFDLDEILHRRSFHIVQWRLTIDELHLEKNEKGVINGVLLKAIKNLWRPKNQGTANTTEGSAFLLDELDVAIRRITYRDRTGVLRKEINGGLKLLPHRYAHVTHFGDLVDEITDQVIEGTGASRIVKLSPFVIEKSIQKATRGTSDLVTGSAELIGESAQKMVKTTKKAAKPIETITREGETLIKTSNPNETHPSPALAAKTS